MTVQYYLSTSLTIIHGVQFKNASYAPVDVSSMNVLSFMGMKAIGCHLRLNFFLLFYSFFIHIAKHTCVQVCCISDRSLEELSALNDFSTYYGC